MMLDDHKYSIGRLVVYEHTEPTHPKQSYGHYGHLKTVGEITAVDVSPTPEPHWVYSIRNVRNQETAKIAEDKIHFGTPFGKRPNRPQTSATARQMEDSAVAEMITKALSVPGKDSMLRQALREILSSEEKSRRSSRTKTDLPLGPGDYIRVRGDLRQELESIHNQYAKIISVEEADIAGIENSELKPGQPSLYRTAKKYTIITPEKQEAQIYDPEIKLFYTMHSRKVMLNWRAATLLAEAFDEVPPYNVEYDFLSDHIFTREELKGKKRRELALTLSSLLYVKGKMGWRDYQHKNTLFRGMPLTYLVDTMLETSRFDSKKNRPMTDDEIRNRLEEAFRLRRLLKS